MEVISLLVFTLRATFVDHSCTVQPVLAIIYLVFTLRATFVDHSCTVQPVLAVHKFLHTRSEIDSCKLAVRLIPAVSLILAVHSIPEYSQ
jgi:hypothetical protein